MAQDFTCRARQLALESYFAMIAEQGLKELLGESGASALLYHIGGTEILKDPAVLESGVRAIFGPGSEIILGYILEKMAPPLRD